MNRRTLKSRWGGKEANRKVLLERVGRGSLGQESMGEQAALLNLKDDHLKRTSAHIQITRLLWTNRIRKSIHLGKVNMTNSSEDVTKPEPSPGQEDKPTLSCSQIIFQ